DRVERVWGLEAELEGCLAALSSGAERRSRLIRLARAAELHDTLALWEAWRPEERRTERQRLAEFVAGLAPAELRPEALVTTADLARSELPPGPRWKELLREAETLQLDGVLRTRADALAWLARVRSEGTGGAARS